MNMLQTEISFYLEFDRVLNETHGEVRAYLATLGVPLDCVDDLAQEVYLAWFRSPERRPMEVEPVRWLKGIARRMALNFFRSKRREDSRLAVVTELLATESLDVSFPVADPTEAALAHCLGKISEKNRSVLRLRYEEGVASHIIGDRVGMTAEAVRILLMRLRAALRDCITKQLREETA
ncbi:MAG: sigma-70 family RNA polymerase sigma factor [bacterium]